MRRMLILGLMALLLGGCDLIFRKSGLEVISYPTARVYIDNKEVGTTPYRNNSLKPGEIDLKLVTDKAQWIKKIRLENGANTVINRELSEDTQRNGGYVLYFESTGDANSAGVMISSQPDRSMLAIDDEIKGYTPIRIANVGEGDRKLTISYPGYKSINSFVKFVKGYQLVVDADLAPEEMVKEPEIVLPTPTPSGVGQKQVVIRETETGWLRVRSEPNSSSAEVGRVMPGMKYNLLSEKLDWFQIDIGGSKTGWVASKYAEKL